MEKLKKDLDCHPIDYLEFVDNDDTWAEEVELNLGDFYEIQVRDGKTFAVKKQPQYPKTYEECLELVYIPKDKMIHPGVNGYKANLLSKFQELLICRDAYWKIADWEPDWEEREQPKFIITIVEGEIELNEYYFEQKILAFPTEEIRNAFYENFKNLINECKELL